MRNTIQKKLDNFHFQGNFCAHESLRISWTNPLKCDFSARHDMLKLTYAARSVWPQNTGLCVFYPSRLGEKRQPNGHHGMWYFWCQISGAFQWDSSFFSFGNHKIWLVVSNIVLGMFTPILGEMLQFDYIYIYFYLHIHIHICQMGGKSHQPIVNVADIWKFSKE